MSGAEVLGVISAIVAIIDAGVKVYDVISDASGLPESFRDVAKRMGLMHVSLDNIANQLSKTALSERAWKAISDVVNECERKAKELDAIFRQALPEVKSSWIERPILAIRTLGKGSRVDSLMEGIVNDVTILTLNHVSQSATESQIADLKQHIDKLNKPPPSQAAPLNHIAERDALLKELDWKDPRLAKDRIERLKGGLYDAASNWILSHPSYKLWKDQDTKLLWIKGAAGKGKTMLLMTILKDLRARAAQDSLVFFFCQNKEPESNNAVSVLKGLIASLLMQDSQLAGTLKGHCDRLGKEAFDPVKLANSFDTLATVFRDLIQSSRADSIYLAVDALDECDNGRSDLINLVRDMSLQHENLKWVVTSRHHISVTDSLALSLEVTYEAVDQGIKAYISHQVSRIPSLESEPVLRGNIEQKLFDKAEGTFLWVDQVLRLMHDYPGHALEQLINEIPSGLTALYERMMRDLEVSGGRYQESCLKVLRIITLAERPLHVRELQVLSGLGEYRRGDMEQVINRCGSFIVLRPETGHVYPIHQSAIDFLLGDQSLDRVFPLGKAAVHRAMVENSFQAMREILKRNVYGLEDPGALMSEVTRPAPDEDPLHAIHYSCAYWVNHACVVASGTTQTSDPSARWLSRFWQKLGPGQGKDIKAKQAGSTSIDKTKRLSLPSRLKHRLSPGRHTNPSIDNTKTYESKIKDSEAGETESGQTVNNDIYDSIASFISGYFLYWLEALALLGGMGQVALAFARLQTIFETSLAPENDARNLIRDSFRFFTRHQPTNSEAPLQAYVSALLFSPQSSIIRRRFSDQEPRWVVKKPDVANEWTPRPPVLDLASSSEPCHSISFSSDGSRFATRRGKNIEIWDVYSGRELCRLPVRLGERDDFESLPGDVTFSSDDVYIAFLSRSKIQIFHIETGEQMWAFNPTGGEGFKTMAFCRDTKQAVSISNNGMIRFWGLGSQQELLSTPVHVEDAECMDLSPDGCHVAWSIASDNAIRVRKIKTRQQPQKFKGHRRNITRLAFSRNSQRLMSWSEDFTARVWDLASGKAICVRMILPYTIFGAISVDGTLIAIPRDRLVVEICDTESGSVRCEISSPMMMNIMEMSPDKRYLAFMGWWPEVWDITCTSRIERGKVDRTPISSISSSLNGRYFAMASDDGVRVWEMGQAGTDICNEHWIGGYEMVRAMIFSPDASCIAILARQGSIYSLTVWDISSGSSRLEVGEIDYELKEIQLSERGTFVGLHAYFGSALQIWDTQSGKLVGQVRFDKLDQGWAFSQDEVYYVFRDGHNTSLREIRSGKQVWAFNYVTGRNSRKPFQLSPNSRFLAFIEHGGGLQAWELSTNRKLLHAAGDTENELPTSLTFSPDSTYLVVLLARVAFRDYRELTTVQLWDVEAGTKLASMDTSDLHCPPLFGLQYFEASEDPSVHWLRTGHGFLKFGFRFSGGNCTTADLADASAPTLSREILPWTKVGLWLCFQGRRMLRLPSDYDYLSSFSFSRDGLSFYISTTYGARLSAMRLLPDPWRPSSIPVALNQHIQGP